MSTQGRHTQCMDRWIDSEREREKERKREKQEEGRKKERKTERQKDRKKEEKEIGKPKVVRTSVSVVREKQCRWSIVMT